MNKVALGEQLWWMYQKEIINDRNIYGVRRYKGLDQPNLGKANTVSRDEYLSQSAGPS
jgi:hypothetical protein